MSNDVKGKPSQHLQRENDVKVSHETLVKLADGFVSLAVIILTMIERKILSIISKKNKNDFHFVVIAVAQRPVPRSTLEYIGIPKEPRFS